MITLITTFLILHQSTSIKQGLLPCKKTLFTEMKTSLGQLSLKYVGSKIWSHLPGKLKSLSLIHLEHNINTSCYFAKISVDFRFICLSLFCNIVDPLIFPCIFYLYSCLPQPPVRRHAFPSGVARLSPVRGRP